MTGFRVDGFTEVQTKTHPSEQHFSFPAQSLSNKHPDVVQVGVHADSSLFIGGHIPALTPWLLEAMKK